MKIMDAGTAIFALLALIFVAVIVARIITASAKRVTSKRCPHCAELVKVEANVCKHCGRELTATGHSDP